MSAVSPKGAALALRLADLTLPKGLAHARAAAAQRLAAAGLPGKRDEYWRYTDPATLFQLALSIAYLQYGPTDRRLVPIYNDLAAFWDQAGDHFKADGYVNQIRSILTA